MSQLRPEISDELWATIRPARARGRWWISLSVIGVLASGLAGWAGGAFHPRAELAWNQSSIDGNLMIVQATITNGGQLPLRVGTLRIDEPGFRLVGSQLGDPASAVPPGQRIGSFSLGRNDLRQLTLDVDLDCADVAGPLQVEADMQGPLVHRAQTMSLHDTAVLHDYCPAATIDGY